MGKGACPAVRTLDLALRTEIPFFQGTFKEPNGVISNRLQTGGNPRHQLGVCLDIILFAQDWSKYDKSVDWQSENILAQNLVKTFIDLKNEMKWTEIIYEDRLFWEPEYYIRYGKDRAHFTHIHIDWMTNSLKGKGKSEDDIISGSPQANTTGFDAALRAKLSDLNQKWNGGQLSNINLASIVKTLSPDLNPVGTWEVKVANWKWIYDFDAKGNVTWRDPLNGENGTGTWKIIPGAITFKWSGSTTTESWNLPIKPTAQTGKTVMEGKPYTVNAVRQ